jgi:hypothetical protein
MTKDDYLRIAREIWGPYLGMSDGHTDGVGYSTSYSDVDLTDRMYAFASAIAALEREECAKVCEYRMPITDGQAATFERSVNTFCAAAIRNKEGK